MRRSRKEVGQRSVAGVSRAQRSKPTFMYKALRPRQVQLLAGDACDAPLQKTAMIINTLELYHCDGF